ncbi:MAG: BatA and WFA domain-containing protein [Gemmataceae bacterium]
MRTAFPILVVLLCLFALPGLIVFAADLVGYDRPVNDWLESRLGVSHRVAISLPAAVVMVCVPLIIVLLYFLRLKRKPVVVSSTFLWKKSIEDLHVNRFMQWLRRNMLMLMQLLAALLLIYAILGPRMNGKLGGGRHYIILIDNSASMSATDVAPAKHRLAWAKAEAIREIDAATDSDSGMVIAFNATAEIRQSYTTNRAALKNAVEAIEPSQSQTRIDEALALASSLANPAKSTENESVAPANPEPGKVRTYVATEGIQADVHLYSDGKFPPAADFALENLNLTFHVPPGKNDNGDCDNLAVLRLDAERNPDDAAKVIVRGAVRNYRGKPVPVSVRLDVLNNGNQLAGSYAKKETLPARKDQSSDGSEFEFTVPDMPENVDAVFRFTIEDAKDSLPLDDTAWVVLGIVRKAKVLLVTPGNFLLRNFFDSPSTKKLADVTYLTPDTLTDQKLYLQPARDGVFDLVIYDRCGPASQSDLPTGNTLFIGYPPPPYKPNGTDPQAVKPVNNPGIKVWDGRHPVMRNLAALYEVEVVEAFQFPDLPPRTPLLMEGERDLALLVGFNRGPYTDLCLTFPILSADSRWNTTWPLKPSFPLFLRNVLFSQGNVRDASAEETIRPGQVKPLRLGAVAEIQVTKPDNSTKTVSRGNRADFSYAETGQLGVYTVAWSGESRRFAVNLFDNQESDLAPAPAIQIGETNIDAGDVRKTPKDLWKWVVLLGLAVIMGEWWFYNKRVQI